MSIMLVLTYVRNQTREIYVDPVSLSTVSKLTFAEEQTKKKKSILNMTPFNKLKLLPKTVKYLVSGYIHQKQTQNASSKDPLLIIYLVLRYFFDGEYFEKAGNDLEISDDGMSIERITQPSASNSLSNTVYGSKWIESNSNKLVRWKFKIESIGKGYQYFDTQRQPETSVNRDEHGNIFIGIASKDDGLNQYWAHADNKPCYKYMVPRFYYMTREPIHEFVLELNTSTGKFEGKPSTDLYPDTVLKGNDIRYKLAVCLTGKDAKLTLTHFEIIDK